MEKVEIGKRVEFSKRFSSDDLVDFARISEDDNPIHLDEAYAAKSIFGQRVVHGVLLVGLFSKIFGTIYPGEGTIYLSQSSKFIKPAFIGDLITARVTLIEFNEANGQGVFLTECFKDGERLVLSGEGRVLFPKVVVQ